MSVTRGKITDRLASPSACAVDAIADTIKRLDFDEAATLLFARAVSGLDVPRAGEWRRRAEFLRATRRPARSAIHVSPLVMLDDGRRGAGQVDGDGDCRTGEEALVELPTPAVAITTTARTTTESRRNARSVSLGCAEADHARIAAVVRAP